MMPLVHWITPDDRPFFLCGRTGFGHGDVDAMTCPWCRGWWFAIYGGYVEAR